MFYGDKMSFYRAGVVSRGEHLVYQGVNINTRLLWTKSREEFIYRARVNCDIDTQLSVFADEICLLLKLFISRPPSNLET